MCTYYFTWLTSCKLYNSVLNYCYATSQAIPKHDLHKTKALRAAISSARRHETRARAQGVVMYAGRAASAVKPRLLWTPY